MTFEQWALLLSVVTTAIAAWVALGISLYNLWQGRPRRRVEAHFVDHPQREEGEVIGVTFINDRGSEVAIEEAGFQYADGSRKVRRQLLGSISTSVRVFPGRKHTYYYGLWEWRNDIREGEPVPLKAYCRDETGRYYEARLSQQIRSALLE